MTKRLTIAIATYNRASYLQQTIANIIPQLNPDVELLVVDGASTDNTRDVVCEFSKNNPSVRYCLLPVKGGVDHDYCQAVAMAHGEYCWLFTDDDLLKPGAVEEVLKAIDEGHDLIVVNLDTFDKQMEKLLDTGLIKISEDRVYDQGGINRFFSDTMHCLTFIGCVVIRRAIWMEREKNKYIGTEFIHVGIIFQKPLKGTVKVISRPLINYRYGMAQWSARGFEIWMFKWPKLVWSFEGIDDSSKKMVCSREPWRSIWKLLVQRSLGCYDRAIYSKLISNTDASFLWKQFAFLISIIPLKMIRFAHRLYCFSRDQKSRDFFRARN